MNCHKKNKSLVHNFGGADCTLGNEKISKCIHTSAATYNATAVSYSDESVLWGFHLPGNSRRLWLSHIWSGKSFPENFDDTGKFFPDFPGSRYAVPARVWAISGRRECWPRIRELSWTLSSENDTVFLSSAEPAAATVNLTDTERSLLWKFELALQLWH